MKDISEIEMPTRNDLLINISCDTVPRIKHKERTGTMTQEQSTLGLFLVAHKMSLIEHNNLLCHTILSVANILKQIHVKND